MKSSGALLIYLIALAYLGLVAISPAVTLIPSTDGEFERIGVLIGLAIGAYWWGAVVGQTQLVDRLREMGVISPRRRDN